LLETHVVELAVELTKGIQSNRLIQPTFFKFPCCWRTRELILICPTIRCSSLERERERERERGEREGERERERNRERQRGEREGGRQRIEREREREREREK
jgi:hypothetical protein